VRAHVAASGALAVSRAMLDQSVVGTELPAHVTVVGVLVDAPTQALLGPDDVVVHVDGATVDPLPVQVAAGRRTLFLYDLTDPDPDRDEVTISVGVTARAALSGVLGTDGSAAGWAAALAGSTLTQLVPDEHLTPDGSVRVRLAKGGRADG
jgi:hypothetical protein